MTNPNDAAIAEFQRTILELSMRLSNVAAMLADAQNKNIALTKEIEELKTKHEPEQ